MVIGFPALGSTSVMRIDPEGYPFQIQKMGRDSLRLQFLREYTQNSIEAIGRTRGGHGSVLWDMYPYTPPGEEGGMVPKLCVYDNGDGMTGDDLWSYINTMAGSTNRLSDAGNYGVGAKISGMAASPAGVMYVSYKNDGVWMAQLWRDPATGQFGFKQWDTPDGQRLDVLDITNTAEAERHRGEVYNGGKMTPFIKGHGTQVIFLGEYEAQDTFFRTGDPGGVRWVMKALNDRYFDFPPSVHVKFRVFDNKNPEEGMHRRFRPIHGMRHFLDEIGSEHHGTVDLRDALAHWWVLKESKSSPKEWHPEFDRTAHVAALWKNEVYGRIVDVEAKRRLQSFGITFGYLKVVLYFEPRDLPDTEEGDPGVTTDLVRRRLLIRGQDVPWAVWGSEFAAAMPEPIRALIEEGAEKYAAKGSARSIKSLLAPFRALYDVPRYRPTPSGPVLADPESPVTGGAPPIGPQPGPQTEKPSHPDAPSGPGGVGGRGGQRNLGRLAGPSNPLPAGVPSVTVSKPDRFPTCYWVGKDELPGFEARIGFYTYAANTLKLNRDFPTIGEVVDFICQDIRSDAPVASAARVAVAGLVRHEIEASLSEAILTTNSLRYQPGWDKNAVDAAQTPEALTLAVAQFRHLVAAVKRRFAAETTSFSNLSVVPSPIPRLEVLPPDLGEAFSSLAGPIASGQAL